MDNERGGATRLGAEEDNAEPQSVPENVLQKLWKLYRRLGTHGGKLEACVVERYNYFVDRSEAGQNCQYAKKYQELFLKHDYEDCKKLFLETLEAYRIVEGDDFGR